VLAGWAKTDPAIKKAAEQKMQSDWGRWMSEHAKMITVTESAAKAFAHHPHLTIPQSSIQVMEVRPMGHA
jgi:hypothetical protein